MGRTADTPEVKMAKSQAGKILTKLTRQHPGIFEGLDSDTTKEVKATIASVLLKSNTVAA